MRKQDFIFIAVVLLVFSPFFISETVYNFYDEFNKSHGMITSFLKFAILATMGESLGLRVKSGVYNKKGFGLLARSIVWGFLGLSIKMAFVIFASGMPIFLKYLGIENAISLMQEGFSLGKLFVAFAISASMNLIYAPVMMTIHKITDTHIVNNGGSALSLLKKIKFGEIMQNIDWSVQWNFVFKKTIPLFWIPAHTITFLLPVQFQVLFAALLGVVLGLLLAVASLMSEKK